MKVSELINRLNAANVATFNRNTHNSEHLINPRKVKIQFEYIMDDVSKGFKKIKEQKEEEKGEKNGK